MTHQGGVAKQGFAGLMSMLMMKSAASTESKFLSLAGMGVLRGIKIRFLLIQ